MTDRKSAKHLVVPSAAARLHLGARGHLVAASLVALAACVAGPEDEESAEVVTPPAAPAGGPATPQPTVSVTRQSAPLVAGEADDPPGRMLGSSETGGLEVHHVDPATGRMISQPVTTPWAASLEDPARMGLERDKFDDNQSYFVGAVLYKDTNLHGASLVLWVTNSTSPAGNFNSFPSGWNDALSSLTLKDGCTITLYEHADRQGRSQTHSASSVSAYALTVALNDTYSSARITCNNGVDAGALIYTGSSFTGTALALWGDDVAYYTSRYDQWTDPGSLAMNGVDTPSSSLNYLLDLGINDGGLYRALDDSLGSTLPSTMTRYIMRFVPRCSPRATCFRGDACDGISSPGGVSSYRRCATLSANYRSYCDNLQRCQRINGEYVIPR